MRHVKKSNKGKNVTAQFFSTIDVMNETEWNEEGNYLNQMLTDMNLSSYDRVKWVRFWLTHSKVALEVLSTCEHNVAGEIEKV